MTRFPGGSRLLVVLAFVPLLVSAPRSGAGAGDPTKRALALLATARASGREWSSVPTRPEPPRAAWKEAEHALAALVAARPHDLPGRIGLAEARAELGDLSGARRTLVAIPPARRPPEARRLLGRIQEEARVRTWAGTRLVNARRLPDGKWLVVTAHIAPDVLAERSLDRAELHVFDPKAGKPRVALPLGGPDSAFADAGGFVAAPAPRPKVDHEPVLNAVDLLVRPSRAGTLVFVAQQIVGASWNPTELQAFRYANGQLHWTLTAGSRGRPVVRDEDGDGADEVVTFHAVGWRLSTARPPLWEETLELRDGGWREANPRFPERYRRVADVLARANAERPDDPDTLFHLARCEAAEGHPEVALARAREAVSAVERWSQPQPDLQERAEMRRRIERYFPAAGRR